MQSERNAAFRKAYIEWLVQALPLWINVYVHEHDWKRVHDLLAAADTRALWLLANPPTAQRKGA